MRIATPTCHVLRAGALLAEPREGVVAGVMAIRPGRRHCVLADQLHAGELGLCLAQRWVRIEPAGLSHLAPAECAGAQPAEGHEVVSGLVAVGPVDLEDRRSAVGVDSRGGEVLTA